MLNIYQKIGKKIRQERKDRRLTLEELSEKIGLATSFLGQIERGDRKMSVATLYKIALALNLAPGSLMESSPVKQNLTLENQIVALLHNQPTKRKKLLFKTLKFLFRQLRSS